MKAIVMSHENGGSYCIDSTGSFHFVKGYEDVDIGTEITIQTKKPTSVSRLLVACVAVLIAVAIASVTCARLSGSQNLGDFSRGSSETIYARICINDSTEYCITINGCTISCPRY